LSKNAVLDLVERLAIVKR